MCVGCPECALSTSHGEPTTSRRQCSLPEEQKGKTNSPWWQSRCMGMAPKTPRHRPTASSHSISLQPGREQRASSQWRRSSRSSAIPNCHQNERFLLRVTEQKNFPHLGIFSDFSKSSLPPLPPSVASFPCKQALGAHSLTHHAHGSPLTAPQRCLAQGRRWHGHGRRAHGEGKDALPTEQILHGSVHTQRELKACRVLQAERMDAV